MPNLKHLFISTLLVLSFSVLFSSLAFAAANDYTVTGGDMAALPDVGATSLAVNAITITDVGGDDILNDAETLIIDINTMDYPSVEFDSAIPVLTIGGTCGYNNHGPLNYASATQVRIDVAGGTNCGVGETITISGLKVSTTYAANAPGSAIQLLSLDNSTTAPGTPVNGDTVQLAVGVGDLTSTSVTPERDDIHVFTDYTVTFTNTAVIDTGGQVVMTFPSGVDVSSISSSLSDCSGITCANWSAAVSGQDVTLTENGTGATAAGTVSFILTDVYNPESDGSGGTYTFLTKDSSGNSLETDAAVTANTFAAYVSHASTIVEPTGLSVVDHEDGGVMLTWADPNGDDSSYIKVYRGIDPYPVNGSSIATVSVGIEYYLDENVEEGDLVTYFLRSTDNFNISDGTDEVTITVGSADSADDETTEEEATDETSEDGSDEEADDEGSESDEGTSDDDSNGNGNGEGVENKAGNGVELSDIETHWARNEIQVMIQAGVVQGNDDGTFAPNDNLNRAEGAALVYRVLEDSEAADVTENPFFDVDMGEWYAPYVGYMKNLGIITGNPDGSYTPGENINRAEYVHVVMAVYEHLNGEVEAVELTDLYTDLDTGEWYGQVISNATALGFVSGSVEDDGTYFNANASITRAEATVILYRMFGE